MYLGGQASHRQLVTLLLLDCCHRGFGVFTLSILIFSHQPTKAAKKELSGKTLSIIEVLRTFSCLLK